MKLVSRSLVNILLSIAFLAASTATFAEEEEEFLPVDEAFVLSVTKVDDATIRASWDIAEGYYVYRDRLKFKPGNDATTFGMPDFPKAKIKNDEFFGEVPVYFHNLTLDIPVKSTSGVVALEIKWQGCAEAGLCYPPQKKVHEFNVAKASNLGGLDSALGGGQVDANQPLPDDQAFSLATFADSSSLVMEWTIADGYYLYKDKISVRPATKGVTIGAVELPAGEQFKDEHFGDVEIYKGLLTARTKVNKPTDLASAQFQVSYQGCKTDSICYPPMTKTVTVDMASIVPAVVVLQEPNIEPETEMEGLRKILERNPFVMFFMFLLLGIGLALTPCVLPMVPILSSVITGAGEEISQKKAFTLSLVYVVAMALTFALAGAVVGALGSQGTAALQNVWVISGFSLILVALALSMFGLYKLQLPNALQSKVTDISNKQRAGNLTGVAIMGILSALIVGPCVTAPLAAALIFIAETGSHVKGFFALLGLGTGMGIPLLLVGTTAGTLLPRAGMWMTRVQHHFGFMILGLAIWMISRVMADVYVAVLWGVLLMSYGVYFNPLANNDEKDPGLHVLGKAIGMVLLLWGTLIMIGVASGGTSITKPIAHLKPVAGVVAQAGMEHTTEGLEFKRVKNLAELDAELAKAKDAGKIAVFDFYADWCTSCIEYEHITFVDPEVKRLMSDMVLLQADVTENNDDDVALQKRFQVIGPPTIVFFDRNGVELKKAKIIGFKDGPAFVEHLNTYVLK